MSVFTKSESEQPDFWTKLYAEGKAIWAQPRVNKWLEENLDVLTAGRENLRILVPMCGKAKDMKWLADKGHEVVGVEGVRFVCEEFYTENDIPYTVSSDPNLNCAVFKSIDGNITIYNCNALDISREILGVFDGIWDRGGMMAVDPCDHAKHRDAIMSVMAPGCQYILDRFEYYVPGRTGAPYNVTVETMQELYGDKCNVEVVDRFNIPEYAAFFKVDKLICEMVKITWKK